MAKGKATTTAEAVAQSEADEAAESGAAPAAAEPKKRGVGEIAKEAIRAGKTNEETLAAIKAELPDVKTTMASVNWYRNQLRSEGEEVPTARELKAKQREAGKAEREAEKAAKQAAKKAEREAEKAAKKAAKAAAKGNKAEQPAETPAEQPAETPAEQPAEDPDGF